MSDNPRKRAKLKARRTRQRKSRARDTAGVKQGKTKAGKWQPVDVSEDAVFSFEYGGFCNLEVLDPDDFEVDSNGLVKLPEPGEVGADEKGGDAEDDGTPMPDEQGDEKERGADDSAAGAAESAAARKAKTKKSKKNKQEQDKKSKQEQGKKTAESHVYRKEKQEQQTQDEGGSESGKAKEEEKAGAAKKTKKKQQKQKQKQKQKQEKKKQTQKVRQQQQQDEEEEGGDKEERGQGNEAQEDHSTTSEEKEQTGEGDAASNEDEKEEDLDMSAWLPFGLHEPIMEGLKMQGFVKPTPVQEECLQPAIQGYRDIVACAETGSGKTLAFGVPLLQHILNLRDKFGDDGEEDGAVTRLKALVLCPTRELAMQVRDHLIAIARPCGIRVVAIVGGMSIHKQQRLLGYRPEVIVGTPGRTWELMASGHPAFHNIKRLRFLVIDEADRMVEEGHFKELQNILEKLPLAETPKNQGNSSSQQKGNQKRQQGAQDNEKEKRDDAQGHGILADKGEEGDKNSDGEDADEEGDIGLPESMFLNPELDMLKQSIQEDKRANKEDDTLTLEKLASLEDQSAAEFRAIAKEGPPVKRQTYICSATLLYTAQQFKKRRRKKDPQQDAVSRIVQMCGLRDKYKTIDLVGRNMEVAAKLSESRIVCTAEEKDIYLIYFLLRHPGRTIVFVNSIDGVHRLVELCRHMDMQHVWGLHSKMQQRKRLINLDRFRDAKSAALIATDVAARGLDIPDVEHVLHYQLPRETDKYVHRSGRTARADKEGLAVVLQGPQDTPIYKAIIQELNRSEELPRFGVELKFLPGIRKRVSLARQIIKRERAINKPKSLNASILRAGKEMDLDVDPQLLVREEIANKGMKKELTRLKAQLKALLKQPVLSTAASQQYTARGDRNHAVLQPDSRPALDKVRSKKQRKSGKRNKRRK